MKHYAVTITKFINRAVKLIDIPVDRANSKAEAEKIALSEFFESNNIRGLKKLLYRASSIFTEHLETNISNLYNAEEVKKLLED